MIYVSRKILGKLGKSRMDSLILSRFITNEIGLLGDSNQGLSLVFEVSRKYSLTKVGVQNDRLELPKGVQSPFFPGLFVICFMAMLSSNGKVLGTTTIHLCRFRPRKKLANA